MKLLMLVSLAAVLFASCGPDLKKFDALKTPAISDKPSQKMLVMEIQGDPANQTKEVGKLFQVYFKLQFKGKGMPSPRARWPKPFDTPRSEWVGYWALPVGDEITALPADAPS